MEPVNKKSKGDQRETASTPQKAIQIDTSKMQKFQRIANSLEQKKISNGSSEIPKKDLKKDASGGKKLELIVGKLSASDRISSRPVPLTESDIINTIGQISDSKTKEAECQTDFDIDKKVKDILQQKLEIENQMFAASEKSSIHKLHKENESLRKKAKELEDRLALAFEKLKKIEATKAVKTTDAAKTTAIHTAQLVAIANQTQSTTTTSSSSTRLERPVTLPAPAPANQVQKSTPPQNTNTKLSHHVQRVPLSQTNRTPTATTTRPPTATTTRPPNVQSYRSPVTTTVGSASSRYAVAQRAADMLLQSAQSPPPANANPQLLPTNQAQQHLHNGQTTNLNRMQMIFPSGNQPPPVKNAGPYQGMPPSYNNVSRLSDNVWQVRPPAQAQASHRQQPQDGSMVYAVRQPPPIVQIIRPQPPTNPLPPPVKLSISSSESGIVLSWDLLNPGDDAGIVDNYHLYACQGTDMNQRTNPLWKRIGIVKALPLPMACTLTQFVRGSSYHFVVAAIDKNGVQGDLSNSCTMRLGNG